VIEALADADVAITNKVRINRAALEQLPRLKLICVDVPLDAYCVGLISCSCWR
jgi:glycerate dehydrogenase